MKKAIRFMIPVVVLVIVMSISATAFSGVNQYEQKLLDLLKNPVKIGEKTYNVSEENKTKAFNYLNRDDVELTEQEAATAETEMKDLTAKVEKMETKDISTLTDAQKNEVVKEMQEAVEVLDLKVNLNVAKDTVTFTDKGGNVVAESTNVVKPTGAASTAAIAVVAVAAVMGCALVLTKKRVHD